MSICWWLAWTLMMGIVQSFCPSGCTCDDREPSASCAGAGISVVPILFNPRMRFLNLAHNSIKSVAQELVFFDQLEELDMSHNTLSSLGTGNFEAQARLRELRLSHNNLTSISPESLFGLSALTLLDLSHNGLTTLPQSVLKNVPKLTILLLSHNKLHKLSQSAFRGGDRLHVLDLCDNYFRQVPSEALESLSALKALHLCRNRLSRVEPKAFRTDSLLTLSLENNIIDSIADSGFYRLKRLLKLNLNDNMLSEIPSLALDPLIGLESLHLSRNKFRNIHEGAFRNLGQLITLEVSRCPLLQTIHQESISQCVNLQSLTLSHNMLLNHIPKGLFTSLSKLKALDLRGNGLQSLPATEVPLDSLTSLYLQNNPMECNCSLQWLAVLLSSPNTTVITQDLRCSSPEKLRGVYISRLSPRELDCVDGVQVVVGIVLVIVSSVLILTLTVFLIRYHRRRKRDKLGSDWPSDLRAPWPPGDQEVTQSMMAEEYIYNSYAPVGKVPVALV